MSTSKSKIFPLKLLDLFNKEKCISNHANIWNGASVRNSQWSLAVDCFCREFHLGCLFRLICLFIILLINNGAY